MTYSSKLGCKIGEKQRVFSAIEARAQERLNGQFQKQDAATQRCWWAEVDRHSRWVDRQPQNQMDKGRAIINLQTFENFHGKRRGGYKPNQ